MELKPGAATRDVRRPNILLLMGDQHSPHTLGCYGNQTVQTPALDGLAARGVLFEDAYCQAPLCVPSRASLMTGRYPWSIGVSNNRSQAPVHLRSLPGHLAEQGYRTVALGKMHFVGSEQFWGLQTRPYGDFGTLSHQPDPIADAPGLSYVEEAGPAEIPEAKTQEAIVTRLGIEVLQAHDPRQPFFLWLSYNRPHHPLRPPERYFERYIAHAADLPAIPPGHLERLHPWMQHHRRFFGTDRLTDEQVRRARAAYYGGVTFLDDQIAQVLRAVQELRMLEDTVVIYTSDHGDMLGEHGLWRKSCFYDGAVRVPLIVSWPGHFAAGLRVPDPVELVDLFPSLAELAGRPLTETDGCSLLGPLTGRGRRAKDYAISEYAGQGVPGPMRMVKRGPWKLVHHLDARPSLFNLSEDPGEFEDRADDPGVRPILEELMALVLRGWDRGEVLAHWQYAPTLGDSPVRYGPRTPNLFCLPDGTLADAEDFYPEVRWDEYVVAR